MERTKIKEIEDMLIDYQRIKSIIANEKDIQELKKMLPSFRRFVQNVFTKKMTETEVSIINSNLTQASRIIINTENKDTVRKFYYKIIEQAEKVCIKLIKIEKKKLAVGIGI